NAPSFAQPILKKIRKAFHKASPEIAESMKWSFPHFEQKGLVGSMAAFKNHVSLGFWKARLMSDPHGILRPVGRTSMGDLRIFDVSELPPEDVIVAYVREAIRLNEDGISVEKKAKKPAVAPEIPDDLAAALKKNRKALATFEKFPPGQRREYIAWITEAKQETTRKRRLATSIEWLAEGKIRNWKYTAKS
ncbi:MAG TPA: YdeI/OmpD-associated family protein, partial [Vicinamibacterales bacterium]